MKNKILIVEHQKGLALSIKEKLAECGYEVSVAGSGTEVASHAKNLKPDVIIIDIMMPKMDGIIVLEELKNTEATKDIPVIVTSLVEVPDEYENKSLQLGAVDFFRKPIDFKKLSTRIGEITNKKTVLVVDDDPDILRLLEVRLQFLSYKVITASNGETALERAQIYKPDIILVDIVLPDMDGFDVINTLKRNKKLAGIPVIAFTGRVSLDGLEDFLGIDKFIGKNFSAEDLVDEVDEYLKNRLPG